MNADLEHVIALQRLDSAEQDAARRLADEPEREKSFVERLETARERLASAKKQLADNQEARRAIEKEVAVHQGRLSKFRETAMAVKTNQEYHAVQKEITYAQSEIKALEEKVLERMIEADELTATVKRAETALAGEQKSVEADRRAMATENAELTALRARVAEERSAVVSGMDKRVLAIFEVVARRRHGIAVAEARDGICTICHVRLRPQVFNSVRRNTEIIQCDTCQRILYFVPPPAPTTENVTQQPSQ
jgi:predicted  nucleic acid-binding Zn-ribbon protein